MPVPTTVRRDGKSFVIEALFVVALLSLIHTELVDAEEPPSSMASDMLTVMREDATLRAVHCVDSQNAWAAGDHGALWNSADAGETWTLVPLDDVEDVSWKSVCFLTNRVGWIAGGHVLPTGGIAQGVILKTTDGGASWQSVAAHPLPYVHALRFFDLDQGIAVGERTTDFPTGVLQTSDGGLTWTPLPAPQSGSWTAAAFTSRDQGIVAGKRGTTGTINQGSLLPGAPGTAGLQSFHAASLDADGRGWLAGDGAYLFRTENHGVSWQTTGGQLPEGLADLVDFRGVAHQGKSVWLAGLPGSVIWHSADNGTTWDAQPTGDPLPLEAVSFSDSRQGIAVGQLGRICVTHDGGHSWRTVQGQSRRLTTLLIQTDPADADLVYLTRWAREEGYRSALIVATRRDLGDDAHAVAQQDLRLRQAVLTAGGGEACVDWRLPLALPALERNREKLLEEWSQLTDRRLSEVLLESLVTKIRAWRPAVILIDAPDESSYTAALIEKAVDQAVRDAADPAFSQASMRHVRLTPWSVRKILCRRPPDNRGDISQDPFEILPRLGTTLDVAVSEAAAQLAAPDIVASRPVSYQVLRSDGPPVSRRSLVRDLGISLGSAARRPVPSVRALDYETLAAQARQRRTMTAISQKEIQSSSQGGGLLGQVNEMLAPLTPAQAACQLRDLGQQYQQHGNWGLAESVYAELITRYPEQPPAVDAMIWLMTFWTSAEMNWQRLRAVRATQTTIQADSSVTSAAVEARLSAALTALRTEDATNPATTVSPSLGIDLTAESSPIMPTSGTLTSLTGNAQTAAGVHQMSLTRWQQLAGALSDGLRNSSPHLFENPELDFLTAALARRRGNPQKADAVYNNYLQTLSDDPWHIAARGEAYLLRPGAQSPKPVISCRRTATPPVLDAVLSDSCWTNATEVRLGAETRGETYVGTSVPGASEFIAEQPVVLFAYDEAYLYLAASVPLHAEMPTDAPDLPGRRHDAELDDFDHLSMQFDVDRDYATYYRFDVDQRGETREACWNNWDYNPNWYCAASRTGSAWRIECAIPLEELLPAERVTGTTWGVGLTRILPGTGSQSWTNSGAEVPNPPLFGLLRFE